METRQTSQHNPSVVFVGLNSASKFSGGRYHAWLMAEAAAEMGWQVSFITNNYPVFYEDFNDKTLFPFHDHIQVHIRPLLKGGLNLKEIVTRCDVIVVIPHGEVLHSDKAAPRGDSADPVYADIITLTRDHQAKTILLNFESPNWFNALSPVKRSVSLWNGWVDISKIAALILSSTAESTAYAREFYVQTRQGTLFEHCWAPINTRVADTIPLQPREKRILLFTRFLYAEHKGGALIPDLFCEAMRGYTVVFIVGAGAPDEQYLEMIRRRADKFGITIEVLACISEAEKWREFKRASLVLFPSYFEGFGLPPVEARYASTPCVAFDLPVLREVNGDEIHYVPVGDITALQQACSKVLGMELLAEKKENKNTGLYYEDYCQRVDALLKRALYETPCFESAGPDPEHSA